MAPIVRPLSSWSRIDTLALGSPHAEPVFEQFAIRFQLRRRGCQLDVALLDDIRTIGDGERASDVLLHQEHSQTIGLEASERLDDARHDGWRKTFGRLVENEVAVTAYHRARNREHLLFAARQAASRLAPALFQDRKELEHSRKLRPPQRSARRLVDERD